jgi:hypothetical protein
MSDSQMELKRQLELLRDIWALFENAKEAAKAWEGTEREKRREAKRKREENDTNTYSLYHLIAIVLCEWWSRWPA